MNCEDCQQELIEYVHNEGVAAQREAITVHLAQCSDCALEYCRLRADVEGIARAYAETPAASVRDALRGRVAQEFSPPWWRRLGQALVRPIPAYGAAAAAALPIVLWFAADAVDRPSEPAPTNVERPAKITDYDATAPLFDPSIL